MTSSVASNEYFLKFSWKRTPSFVTSALKLSAPCVQAFCGFSSSDGTPEQVLGTARLKVSYVSYSTVASSPEWMASRIARVYFRLRFVSNDRRGLDECSYGQRLPPAVAPAPIHPVFSSQELALCCSILPANILAYRMGCRAKNG